MTPNQEFTPKYWIVHDPELDDVFLFSADKCRSASIKKYLSDRCGGNWYMDTELPDNLSCDLMEIKLVPTEIKERK